MTRAPALLLSERGSLDKFHHSNVDSVLKDLKPLSRRLFTMTMALEDETQILDRLHYKNRNQHRSALFSRRVNELRRYSHRVEELQLYHLVDDLRQSFFGRTEKSSSKQQKGSWTHYANEKYVLHVREQLSTFLQLLKKMHVISYSAFEWVLQSSKYL
ncbi:hypothetical protein BDP27DRAFT_1325173 [Rhodocollybia butyracea]|uniref:Uncharacterized protein n=1 Tax=Rhodocollybia butyracea TaxID=206335 RepID=A0A9P5PX51_9AGAR|nr:hypothetical protein BDP27DRAFT_1325173 [Rhodocollybia butyracea]